ncbi:MAG: DUF1080 domain-containing protein [Planctomycetales bacterium]|nr:DUF1080 domain-containing protein [Planctomycetales bacterium]
MQDPASSYLCTLSLLIAFSITGQAVAGQTVAGQAVAGQAVAGQAEDSRADGEPGFVSIFNGKDLNGWRGEVDNYTVQEGAIVCQPGKGGVLYYQEEYADFVVRLKFRLPPGGNNGLAIRYPGTGRASTQAMCELQVLDDSAEKYKNLDGRQYHGAIYGMVAPKRDHLLPVGEWNEQEVTVIGSTIRVVLNGVEIINADVSKVTQFKDDTEHPGKNRTSGFFGFAGHNDPVQFRNVRIKRLPSSTRVREACQ